LSSERSALVSVILPAFNAEKTISDTVNSVLAQSYEAFELIIIDDCSTDGTAAIIEEFEQKDARIRSLRNERNIGVLKTRLNGIRAAFGSWIAFIDSDDLWNPDKLEKQMNLQQETSCDLVFSGVGYIDTNGKPLSWVLHVPQDVTYEKLLKQNVISNSSVVIRKDVFLHYTPVSEDKRDLHEDYACWLQLLRNGHKVKGLDEPLATYRVSKNSMTGNKFHSAVLNWYTYRFVGLNWFQTVYYMICYTVRGIRKYSHLRKKT
jgi:teichuronic acid biosynthesis glycosyltransferase TuaG